MANKTEGGGPGLGGGRRIAAWAAFPTLLLLAPLIAMQFTDDVDWDGADFAFMGVLLASGGLVYALTTIRMAKPAHRALVGSVVLAVVFVIWADAAVGVIGIFGGT